jgi:uncharacterized protein YjbI with pentapeptide repeats
MTHRFRPDHGTSADAWQVPEPPSTEKKSHFHWGWVWLALVVAAITATSITLLLWGKDVDAHRQAFDIGWKSAAAIMAILATFITVHRLRLSQYEHAHKERIDKDIQLDAIERRVTELYAKAADQVGSEKAPVRIAGLYALERLGENHPEHRQAIIEVICGYLRMPHEITPFKLPDPYLDDFAAGRSSETGPIDMNDQNRQEVQVRLTAQRIITRHLERRNPSEAQQIWPGLYLDLRGATLYNLNFSSKIINADFDGAKFINAQAFDNSIFTAGGRFHGTHFSEHASFRNVIFKGHSNFIGTVFLKGVRFDETTFAGQAAFSGARIVEEAIFRETNFDGPCEFWKTELEGAIFEEASFAKNSTFRKTIFSGQVRFDGSIFSDLTSFDETHFMGDAKFYGTTFNVLSTFWGTIFEEFAGFNGAKFLGLANFDRSIFNNDIGFEWATAKIGLQHRWPQGFTLVVPADPGKGEIGNISWVPERSEDTTDHNPSDS